MKLAAIDIGSNAARLIISRIIKRKSGKIRFKKVHYMRYPLRLGKDVFKNGAISKDKTKEFIQLAHIFRDLMRIYNVKHYMACATSAMRESSNGSKVSEKIFKATSIKIDLIDGQQEAKLLNNVLYNFIEYDKNCIHVDVGGGSTEINIYINSEKVHSESFKIGSVRNQEDESARKELEELKKWLTEHIADKEIHYAIGTGGNIRKLHKLSVKEDEMLELEKLEETKKSIEKYSFEERINVLLLNPDRADVIIPAAQIYIDIMKQCKIDSILVPDIGLKDGIMRELYESTAFLID